jgi:hypothetical protein
MMSLNDQTEIESTIGSATLPRHDETRQGKSRVEQRNLATRGMLLADTRVSVALVAGREPKRVLALLQPSVSALT